MAASAPSNPGAETVRFELPVFVIFTDDDTVQPTLTVLKFRIEGETTIFGDGAGELTGAKAAETEWTAVTFVNITVLRAPADTPSTTTSAM